MLVLFARWFCLGLPTLPDLRHRIDKRSEGQPQHREPEPNSFRTKRHGPLMRLPPLVESRLYFRVLPPHPLSDFSDDTRYREVNDACNNQSGEPPRGTSRKHRATSLRLEYTKTAKAICQAQITGRSGDPPSTAGPACWRGSHVTPRGSCAPVGRRFTCSE